MSRDQNIKIYPQSVLGQIMALIVSVSTGMIGYTIHGSLFWAIIDWGFWPIVWVKWLCYQEVNLTVIKNTFGFLAQ